MGDQRPEDVEAVVTPTAVGPLAAQDHRYLPLDDPSRHGQVDESGDAEEAPGVLVGQAACRVHVRRDPGQHALDERHRVQDFAAQPKRLQVLDGRPRAAGPRAVPFIFPRDQVLEACLNFGVVTHAEPAQGADRVDPDRVGALLVLLAQHHLHGPFHLVAVGVDAKVGELVERIAGELVAMLWILAQGAILVLGGEDLVDAFLQQGFVAGGRLGDHPLAHEGGVERGAALHPLHRVMPETVLVVHVDHPHPSRYPRCPWRTSRCRRVRTSPREGPLDDRPGSRSV